MIDNQTNIVNYPTVPPWVGAVGHANWVIIYIEEYFIPIMEYIFDTH